MSGRSFEFAYLVEPELGALADEDAAAAATVESKLDDFVSGKAAGVVPDVSITMSTSLEDDESPPAPPKQATPLAPIAELLLIVVVVDICLRVLVEWFGAEMDFTGLVGCFFGGSAAVARLGYGSRGVIFCLRGCLFEIFGPGLSQRFINPLFGISFVVRVLIRLKISALGFALNRKAGNLTAILLLQPVINPPKFIEARLIKLGLLAALAACIDLDVKRSTGELWG